MKLYGYWRSSCSWRVRIALAYKGFGHELVPVHLLRGGGEQRLPGFLGRNPIGQVPVLELEHAGEPVTLSQSLAIIEYLEEIRPAPPLLPADPLARARARQLSEIVNSGIQPLQNTGLLQHLDGLVPGFDRRKWLEHFIGRGLDALERASRASAGRYLVGDAPSLADVCLVPQLYAARRFGAPVAAYPTLLRAEAECRKLEAFHGTRPEAQPDAEASEQSR